MRPERERPDADSERSSTDRSFDLDAGHRLPVQPDPERATTVFDPAAPNAIEWFVEQLVGGALVAFPTDTVYAVATSLAHDEAIARLLAIKTRHPDKPIPVLLASAADLALIARDPNPHLVALAGRFWPGPLTVALPARAGMPAAVVAADGTVGTRVPNHRLALEVIERAGGAVAATSANRAGQEPARDAAGVLAALSPDLDILLDGGMTPGGVPSTVVAPDHDQLRIVREGAIPARLIDDAWREILAGHVDPAP